jgi:hypothetical protein
MATENDIVLIYFEDRPLSFARIESILPDAKPNWYHVELLMLQVPLQVVSWILRDVYIEGDEFTMNGKKMRLELVEKPSPAIATAEIPEIESDETSDAPEETGSHEKTSQPTQAKVISLKDLKSRSS